MWFSVSGENLVSSCSSTFYFGTDQIWLIVTTFEHNYVCVRPTLRINVLSY